MAQPYNYTVQQPQVSSYFDAFRQGKADRMAGEEEARNKSLAQYLPGALQGDAQAKQQALASASPDQQIALSGHFAQMKAADLARMKDGQAQIASMAVGARTPDAWALVNAKAKELFPGSPDIPFEQREMVIARAQTVSEQLSQALEQKRLALDESRTRAQNAASYASADASRASQARAGAAGKAPQGYMWSPDGSSLVAVPGGPADPTQKLTEGQSKDLGFFNRGAKANEEMTARRLGAMTSGANTLGRTIIGNAGQSAESRQGVQASKNFIAALLRKDTGAAVTPQEFDFYSDIFLPQFGDDDQTVRQKAEARVEALNAIRQGLGGADVLALPAVQSLSGGGRSAPAAAPQAAPSMGQVVNRGGESWRFLGGNPADKSRWRREP